MSPRLGEQQEALYLVEHETISDLGRRWDRVSEAQVYLSALVNTDWFFNMWPHVLEVRVERRGSGSRWSTCQRWPGGGSILVADGALRQPTVLHELAHLLNPPDEGHGDLFARTLLTLLHLEMGLVAYTEFLYGLRATHLFNV